MTDSWRRDSSRPRPPIKMLDPHQEKVLILDFGSQYTQLIARRVRELKVYCEIHPYIMTLENIEEFAPEAIILSGGPRSVYDRDAPAVDPEVFSLGVPILGICYGIQLLNHLLGGEVAPAEAPGIRLQDLHHHQF